MYTIKHPFIFLIVSNTFFTLGLLLYTLFNSLMNLWATLFICVFVLGVLYFTISLYFYGIDTSLLKEGPYGYRGLFVTKGDIEFLKRLGKPFAYFVNIAFFAGFILILFA